MNVGAQFASVRQSISGRFEERVRRVLEAADVTVNGDRPWDPQVRDPRVFDRIATQGTLGVGESYMDGWWTCEQVDELVARVSRAGTMGALAGPVEVARWAQSSVLNLQTQRRSREVGRRHYDIGNDLYAAMLDPLMIYSCAYWATADDLAQAQTDKLDLIAHKLGLEPGMRVLDIGCGWGGAAKHFASRYGCEVVGVTISTEQASLARQRVEGLPVEIRDADYRTLDEAFDRIYSIGMFEHVGVKNYATFMDVVRRCLNAPDALMVLHTIGRLTPSNRTDPWITRYIFPNSMLPSASQIASAFEGRLVMEDWQSFGPDYDRTLMAWHDNVNAAWDDLPPTYDARFRRMWNFYLLASAGAFRARSNQLWQVVLSRDGIPASYRPQRWQPHS